MCASVCHVWFGLFYSISTFSRLFSTEYYHFDKQKKGRHSSGFLKSQKHSMTNTWCNWNILDPNRVIRESQTPSHKFMQILYLYFKILWLCFMTITITTLKIFFIVIKDISVLAVDFSCITIYRTSKVLH